MFDRLAGLGDVDALRRRVRWLDLVPAAVRGRWMVESQLPGFTAEDFVTFHAFNAHNARITAALAAAGAPLLVGTDTGVAFVVPARAAVDCIR